MPNDYKSKYISNLAKPQMVDSHLGLNRNFPNFKKPQAVTPSSPSATAPSAPPVQESSSPDALSSLKGGLENLSSSLASFQQNSQPKVDPRAGYKSAFDAYIQSLQPTSQETEAGKRLNEMTTQNRLDYEKALNQGETLNYSTGLAGQQARTAGIQESGAAASLMALAEQRGAMTEAQKARLDFEKSLIGETPDAKPFQAGDVTYQYDPESQTYKSIASKADQKSAPRIIGSADAGYYTVDDDGNVKPLLGAMGGGGEKAPSAQELKVFINKQIATPEFQALTPEEKALYIQSQGGTPYDFGF